MIRCSPAFDDNSYEIVFYYYNVSEIHRDKGYLFDRVNLLGGVNWYKFIKRVVGFSPTRFTIAKFDAEFILDR